MFKMNDCTCSALKPSISAAVTAHLAQYASGPRGRGYARNKLIHTVVLSNFLSSTNLCCASKRCLDINTVVMDRNVRFGNLDEAKDEILVIRASVVFDQVRKHVETNFWLECFPRVCLTL